MTTDNDIELPEGWIETTSLGDTRRVFLDPDGRQWDLDHVIALNLGKGAAVKDGVILEYPEDHPDHPDHDRVVAAAWNPPVPVPAPVHTWQDSDPKQLKQALMVRSENRGLMMEWIRNALVEGVDYGPIHIAKKDEQGQKCRMGNRCTNPDHWSKPSLWKPGAEKISGMLGLRPEWPHLDDMRVRLLEGCQDIVLICNLVNPDGRIISEGVGARSLNQDYMVINKSIKMAKKSSHIDAALNASGLSEVFTQDMSDEDSMQDNAGATLDEDGVRYLRNCARELFGDRADPVINSLCRRRFHIDDGDPYQIPAFRLQDAIRSLEEKAYDGFEADDDEAEA